MPQETSSDDIILPPNPAGLIEGLRDTGYTFDNALADIAMVTDVFFGKMIDAQIF